mmetsp:Transcript_157426/g.501781  ORF Transcript_157426/g.501781 Transcript_157426/m.501781 type:complete len:203 (-) Transcript_157426:23-631(-)
MALGDIRVLVQARCKPLRQVRVDLQGYDLNSAGTFQHRHRAIADEHADLQNSARVAHEYQVVEQDRLQRVGGHLLAIGEHRALLIPFLGPAGRHHLLADKPHGRALTLDGLRDAIGILLADNLRKLRNDAFHAAGQNAPLRARGQRGNIGLSSARHRCHRGHRAGCMGGVGAVEAAEVRHRGCAFGFLRADQNWGSSSFAVA